jgi:hypothetical protein
LIREAADDEFVGYGASKFLGSMNLLTGQTVFPTAVVTQPLRYIAVERDALRSLHFSARCLPADSDPQIKLDQI